MRRFKAWRERRRAVKAKRSSGNLNQGKRDQLFRERGK